jgi:aquaporin Z
MRRPHISTPIAALKRHWFLYVYEGAELAIFMLSACFVDTLLYATSSPVPALIPSLALRGLIMGASMGITAILIIHSPIGKASGAHFNPSITLTYLRLGKIAPWDAVFYIAGQFFGSIAGVGISALILGSRLALPPVEYAITIPGKYGTAAAFFAEFFMATLLMSVVLWTSNRRAYARYTSYFVGTLITFYVLFFGPVSGFSINPARTVGSAVFAHIWTAIWLYFTAPILGMLTAAQGYIAIYGSEKVVCAKLHHAPSYLCSNDDLLSRNDI